MSIAGIGVDKLDISYNEITEVRLVRNVNELSNDYNFGVLTFIFDGNQMKAATAKNRLTGILKGSRRLKEVSLRKC